MSALNAPFATSSSTETYGAIKGSCPSWDANWLDKGRKHVSSGVPSELGSTTLQTFYASSGEPQKRLVKEVPGPSSSCYAEPVVQGANSSYFSRRAMAGELEYRRTLKHIPEPVYVDRPTGKRSIPEPNGAPPRTMGVMPQPAELRNREPQRAAEPGMPRLSRPYGATILRESEQELLYEKAMGTKVRVGLDTYRGSGRAGDLSYSCGPPKRPEDQPGFFGTLKDSPTFIRFVSSLPAKPAVSPHQRRADELLRAHKAEVDADKRLVASLQLPNEGGADD